MALPPGFLLDTLRKLLPGPGDEFGGTLRVEQLVDLGEPEYPVLMIGNHIGTVDDGRVHLHHQLAAVFRQLLRCDRHHGGHARAQPPDLLRAVFRYIPLQVQDQRHVLAAMNH